MANTVYESQTNEHILVKFLADLHSMLDDKTVWGSHLGSETLMRRHKNTRTRIACITVLEKRRNEIELRKKQEAAETSLEALPEECVREILCKLSDYRDVENEGKDRRIFRKFFFTSSIFCFKTLHHLFLTLNKFPSKYEL